MAGFRVGIGASTGADAAADAGGSAGMVLARKFGNQAEALPLGLGQTMCGKVVRRIPGRGVGGLRRSQEHAADLRCDRHI